ncbi:MAG: 16S rRNA (cytosine(967)-C(5))-methyltransferase RsmB [Gammaproteobacteria bacterium]|nr:MAG: 16S rRNA (cytosine(967)-C(5))-methyltransferase RsmB [Gammaproteobacteria bacterium]
MSNARLLSLQTLLGVVQQKGSLNTLLEDCTRHLNPQDSSLVNQLSYGVLRQYEYLSGLTTRYLKKPLKSKDQDISLILLLGLYQLLFTRIKPHAAIHETVALTRAIHKSWASGLVNGILRRIQRTPRSELRCEATLISDWLLQRLQHDWPDEWPTMLEASRQHPPMTLRINPARTSVYEYLTRLEQHEISAKPVAGFPQALILEHPVPVSKLPGFDQGHVSVQDTSAQLVAPLLQAKPGMRILDACAAPGGKSAHLLELQPQIGHLLAMDIEEKRSLKLASTIQRLQFQNVSICTADATHPEQWWDGQPFDGIMIDAPCSGTGVIRRHPDIKFLRRESDIDRLAEQQKKLLHACWALLKSGGRIVYSTCSILHQENTDVIAEFIASSHARETDSVIHGARPQRHGMQILPGLNPFNGDGFYLSCLEKT